MKALHPTSKGSVFGCATPTPCPHGDTSAGLKTMGYGQAQAALSPSPSPNPSQAPGAPSVAAALQSALLQPHAVFGQVLCGARLLGPGHPDPVAVSALQSVLQAVGVDCGPVDGLWGAQTTAGVQAFQAEQGLSGDGILGPLTIAALDEDVAERGQVASGTVIGPDGQPVQSAIGYNADERMEFADDGSFAGIHVYDLDNEAAGHTDGDALPWSPFFLTWNHQQILARWSQIDTTTGTLTDKNRCQSHAAMAPRIVEGPDALYAFGRTVQRLLEMNLILLTMTVRMRDPLGTGPEARTLAALPGELAAALDRLGSLTARSAATFADLAWIAEATRWATAGDTTATPDADDAAEAHGLGVAAGAATAMNVPVRSRAELMGHLQALAPSESYSVGVDPSLRGPSDPSAATHSITLGREPSGALYLYDPFPKAGDQFMAIDLNDNVRFWPYFERSGGQAGFKETILDSKADASQQQHPAPDDPFGQIRI